MIILGVDPGYDLTGFAIVDFTFEKMPKILKGGVIKTAPGVEYWQRIVELQQDVRAIIMPYTIAYAGLEQLFFSKNVKTAVKVAQARGVIGAEIVAQGVPLLGFTPPQIKAAVVGTGTADKLAMQEAVRFAYNLDAIPQPDDFADALGVALCTYYTAKNSLGAQLYL